MKGVCFVGGVVESPETKRRCIVRYDGQSSGVAATVTVAVGSVPSSCAGVTLLFCGGVCVSLVVVVVVVVVVVHRS